MHTITKVILVIVACFISLIGFAQKAEVPELKFEWFPPNGVKAFPAVLVIGGSEGGMRYGQSWSKLLNSKGFGVMALSYFGSAGLPQQLEEIPLEYFQAAFDSLKRIEGVNPNQIAVISVSKGTEAAFWLASRNSDIQLVVAGSPSNLVWQSVNRESYANPKSSWSFENRPLPFVPYDYSNGYYPIINFYKGALEKEIDPKTLIPLEKSKATIVLLSGAKDNFWPASEMSRMLKDRLEQNQYQGKIILEDFAEAGHGFLNPYTSEDQKQERLKKFTPALTQHLGGTVEGFDKALTRSLEIVLSELEMMKAPGN